MIIVNSIGTAARDFSTIQGWADSIPATLADEYIGEAYNDSEFVDSVPLLILSGHTGSFYIRLRPANGQGWNTPAARSRPKRYNQTNGVAARVTAGTATAFQIDQNLWEFSGFQIKTDATGCRPLNQSLTGTSSDHVAKDLLIETVCNANPAIQFQGIGGRGVNISIYYPNTGGSAFRVGAASFLIGCDAVRNSAVAASGTGFASLLPLCYMQDCNTFGFATAASGSGLWAGASCFNNATDKATGLPGSNNQHSVPYNRFTPWRDISSAGRDLRPIQASRLIRNGALNATYAPLDCTLVPRPAAPTIGSWEDVQGAQCIMPSVVPGF